MRQKVFSEKLYSSRQVTDINFSEVLNFSDIPKLNEQEKTDLEGLITKEELLICLKNMKNNKSPGSDGFTAEFFKFFWPDIGDFILRSINYGFSIGELSITQKEGVITCIPKGDKDKQYLKNWRPISLLNVIYKLASACIANRLKKVLPKLINEDQTGFITGRYIGENIRNLYDLFHYTKKNNVPGLLLLIDFEKAFDSVAWSFIHKVLDFFNFGPSIKKWITVFYNNIKSCVLVNGQISEWFSISRGCRQGDPLSPYLFILCAEILALMIRKNGNIKGITVGYKEYLVGQYADDTSLTLDGSRESLHHALQILKFYANASGLQVNMEKTRLIWFGSLSGSERTLFDNLNLCWDQGTFKLLGVKFSVKLDDMVRINYEEKLREVKDLLIQWSKRILTPYGRITVVKSLAIAKINHLFLALPNPPDKIVQELNSLFFKYIWNGSIDRVKRDISIKNYKEGGLRMVKIQQFIDAIKISWIRRNISSDTKWKSLLFTAYPTLEDFHLFGQVFFLSKINRIDNKFWYDTFQAWINFLNKIEIRSWDDFLKTPIWCNKLLKVGGKSILYKHWVEKGLLSIYDIIDSNGNFYELNYLLNTINLNTNFIEYQGIINTITSLRTKLQIMQNNYNVVKPNMPLHLKLLTRYRKGCQLFYKILSSNRSIPTSQTKWQNELLLQNHLPWQKIYNLPYRITKDTNCRWFQYRLTHRILSTNTFLTKIGIKEDNLCTFCKSQNETLVHLFWSCDHIQIFWNNLTQWLNNTCRHIVNINLDKENVIFGILDNRKADETLNLILLLAKKFIYRMKYNDTIPSLSLFKNTLRHYYNGEKYIAFTNCSWDKFSKKWQLYNVLFEQNTN